MLVEALKEPVVRIRVARGYMIEGMGTDHPYKVGVDIMGGLNLLTGQIRTEGTHVAPYPETILEAMRREVEIVAPKLGTVSPDLLAG